MGSVSLSPRYWAMNCQRLDRSGRGGLIINVLGIGGRELHPASYSTKPVLKQSMWVEREKGAKSLMLTFDVNWKSCVMTICGPVSIELVW